MDTDFHEIIQNGQIINPPEQVIIGKKYGLGVET